MPRFGLKEQFNLEGPYNRFLPESYEGFLFPRQGPGPFKIVDDPAIIKQKNAMREALRNEYTKRMMNPYRSAAGVGGAATDPMLIRYNAMLRTQYDFFRPGPRTTFVGLLITIGGPIILGVSVESWRSIEENRRRTGQVSYSERRTFL